MRNGYKAKVQGQEQDSRKRQRTLTIATLPIAQRRKLDEAAAIAVLWGHAPFDYGRMNI